MNRKEALATLNLSEGAGIDEVKKAYRRLAFELHPDLHPDRPEMARRFQLLNEAYMLLSKPGGAAAGESGAKYGSTDPETEKTRAEAQKAYAQAKWRFGEGKTFKAASSESSEKAAGADDSASSKARGGRSSPGKEPGQGPGQGPGQNGRPAGKSKSGAAGSDFKYHTFQTPEQREAFRRTLKDPFARSVFKEIYRQLREEKGRKRLASRLEKTGVGRVASGVVGAVKGWFRRQIDDEQEVFVPSGILHPGQKVRLQVRQGLSGELKTIELVLPADYSPSKPIRLKGFGKKIGSLQGDLYIKIIPQMDSRIEAGR